MKRIGNRLLALCMVLILATIPMISTADEYMVMNYIDLPPLEDGVQEEGRYTVTFETEETSWQVSVDANTLVKKPTDPASPDGSLHFTGWFLEGSDNPFDFSTIITENITLTAGFGDAYAVSFLNSKGTVVHVEWVAPGETVIDYRSDELGITADKQFMYWYPEGTDGTVPFDFSEGIEENIRLLPYIGDTLIAIFISEGTQVPPQHIDGQTALVEPDPEKMIRPGYSFRHWSKTENGEDAYSFTEIEQESITLYAVWAEEKVNYTIIYWKEAVGISGTPSLPDEYIYAFTNYREGDDGALVGSPIEITKAIADALVPSAYTTYISKHFEFVAADEDVEALGDGSSVVNVYYKRKLHTLTFDFGNGAQWYTTQATGDTKLTAKTYSFQAKLDEFIGDRWPNYIEVSGAVFSLWGEYFSLYSPTIRMSEGTYNAAYGSYGKGIGYLVASYKKYGDYVYRKYCLEIDADEAVGADDYIITKGTKRYRYVPSLTTGYQQTNTRTGYKGWPGRSDVAGYQQANPDRNGANVEPPVEVIDPATGQQLINSDGQAVYDLYYLMDKRPYTVTFNASGGTMTIGGASVGEHTYTGIKYQQVFDSSWLDIAPEKHNSTFEGWYYDLGFAEKANYGDAMGDENIILYAKYSSSGVTVNFYEREGANAALTTRETAPGGLVSLPSENYQVGEEYSGKGIFQGWAFYVGGVRAWFSPTMPITDDLDVYGQWKGVPYTVTYYTDELGSDVLAAIKVNTAAGSNTISENGEYPPDDPVREGYSFRGWYESTDGSGTRFTAGTAVTGDVFLYPYFVQLHTITSSVVNGVISPEGAKVVDHGASLGVLYAPLDDSYALESVTVDGVDVTDSNGSRYDFTAIDDDHQIDVVYVKKEYTITALVTNGTISHEGITTVAHGDSLNVTYAPKDNSYALTSVHLDGRDVTEAYASGHAFTSITESHTIEVVYTKKIYTVATNVINGFISPDTGNTTVEHGDTLDITYSPLDEGYELVSVTVDDKDATGGSSTKHTFKNITSDHAIEVVYARKQYAVTTEVTNGTISPETGSTTVLHGDSLEVSYAPLDDSYALVSVHIDNVNVTQEYADGYTFDNVTDNHSIKVVYAKKKYTVTTRVENGTIAPKMGSTTVDHGSDLSVTYAPKDDSFALVSVLLDGVDISEASPSGYDLTDITDDHEIEVVYAKKQFTVTTKVTNGTISPDTGDTTVSYGDSQKVTYAPLDSSYELISVLIDGTDWTADAKSSHSFRNITENHSIEVVYGRKQYTVTTRVENGTIVPADGDTTVPYGEYLAVSYAPADASYELVSVLVDGKNVTASSTSGYVFDSVTNDHLVEVVYARKPYQLTVRHYLINTTRAVRTATTETHYIGDKYAVAADYSLYPYVPTQANVTGTMPGQNLELIIYYQYAGRPEPTVSPTEEPPVEPTVTPVPTARPQTTGTPDVTPSPEPTAFPIPSPEPIESYDPENPPEVVVEARKRTQPALFTLYDSDVPLSGLAARTMGDKEE